jgi:hypothetical protein
MLSPGADAFVMGASSAATSSFMAHVRLKRNMALKRDFFRFGGGLCIKSCYNVKAQSARFTATKKVLLACHARSCGDCRLQWEWAGWTEPPFPLTRRRSFFAGLAPLRMGSSHCPDKIPADRRLEKGR